MRTDPPAITLDPAKADEYCGRYALTPEIAGKITGFAERREAWNLVWRRVT